MSDDQERNWALWLLLGAIVGAIIGLTVTVSQASDRIARAIEARR